MIVAKKIKIFYYFFHGIMRLEIMFHDVLDKKTNYFRVKKQQLFRTPKLAILQRG